MLNFRVLIFFDLIEKFVFYVFLLLGVLRNLLRNRELSSELTRAKFKLEVTPVKLKEFRFFLSKVFFAHTKICTSKIFVIS